MLINVIGNVSVHAKAQNLPAKNRVANVTLDAAVWSNRETKPTSALSLSVSMRNPGFCGLTGKSVQFFAHSVKGITICG